MKPMTFAFNTNPTHVSKDSEFDQGTRSRVLLQGLRRWRQRASSRRSLSQLSRHQLRDIGIDRAAAEIEARKPFWKA